MGPSRKLKNTSAYTEADEARFRDLIKTLWSWPSCAQCESQGRCSGRSCAWRRRGYLDRFFKHCQEVTFLYYPQNTTESRITPAYHEGLIRTIEIVKRSPVKTRQELYHEGCSPLLRQGNRQVALRHAVKLLYMVHSHTGYAEAVYLEHGLRNSAWKPNESLSAFIARKFAIYQREGPAFDVDQSGSATDIKPTLKARKLKKRLGLKFRPTDDLSNHLKLDRRQGDAIVLIFNQIAYLKEQLRLTKDTPKVSTLDDWLLMCVELASLCRLVFLTIRTGALYLDS